MTLTQFENLPKDQQDRISVLYDEAQEQAGTFNLKFEVYLQGIDRPLSIIAKEIKSDWKNVYFGAVPYLETMETLNNIEDTYYGADTAKSIVIYFLSNATTWRGETARRIKAELKLML
jgi:hypothetical protein